MNDDNNNEDTQYGKWLPKVDIEDLYGKILKKGIINYCVQSGNNTHPKKA